MTCRVSFNDNSLKVLHVSIFMQAHTFALFKMSMILFTYFYPIPWHNRGWGIGSKWVDPLPMGWYGFKSTYYLLLKIELHLLLAGIFTV